MTKSRILCTCFYRLPVSVLSDSEGCHVLCVHLFADVGSLNLQETIQFYVPKLCPIVSNFIQLSHCGKRVSFFPVDTYSASTDDAKYHAELPKTKYLKFKDDNLNCVCSNANGISNPAGRSLARIK